MKINKLPRNIINVSLASAILVSTGCASIITSGDRTIPISSNPPAATVTVYDMNRQVVANGTTPAKIKLKKGAGYFKGADYRLVIEKAGFQSKEIEIRHNMNGWYFGNFALGGMLGLLVIDPLTGGMWVLKPDKVDVELAPSTASASDSVLPVVTRNDLTPEQQNHLVPLTVTLR